MYSHGKKNYDEFFNNEMLTNITRSNLVFINKFEANETKHNYINFF